MSAPIRVVVVGLGPIGRAVVQAVVARPALRIVAAADPAFAGRDVGEVAGLGVLGVPVAGPAAEAFATPADVALVLTTSGVETVAPTIEAALAAGKNVVSTCEELACAEHATPALAARLDAQARAAGLTVLGTGVNPGFVMDRLPLALVGACVAVRHVRVERVLDAARRRGPLQAKVGAGLLPDEFAAGVAAGTLGHRGLAESAVLLGTGLGRAIDEVATTIAPVLTSAEAPRAGVEPGRVAGLRQSASGREAGREIVRLELEMSMAAPAPHDRIVIDGDPPLDVTIAGGTHGDRGTVGTTVNAISAVVAARPGLLHVTDLPLFGVR